VAFSAYFFGTMRLCSFLLRPVLAAAFLGCSLRVSAQEPTQAAEPHSELRVVPSPAGRLIVAVRAYQASRPSEAQALLAGLVNDTSYADVTLRQTARTYLGEVLFRQGDQDAARRMFERILTEDPRYRIDPFEHPPDVCAFFETIRAYIQPKQPPPPTPDSSSPPLPSVAYVGFGIYQLTHNRRRMGTAMLATQTIAGVLSAATFSTLLDGRSFPAGEGERVETLRSVQWASTSVFWGTWAWSVIDAGRHWKATAVPIPAGSAIPGGLVPAGLQLRVSGRFH
jgi:hypothetical protein